MPCWACLGGLLLAGCAIPTADAPPEAQPENPPAPVEIIRQHRPPLHSRAYSEAITDALRFEEEDVSGFERSVAADPADWIARAKILAYASRADQVGLAENLVRRKTHVFWLIEHDPGSELLRSYLGRFQPGELTEQEWSRVAALWDSAAQAHPADDNILANAAHFFGDADPVRRRRYLELAAAAAPENARHGADLGSIYARAIVASTIRPSPATPQAAEAEQILKTTNNAAMVEMASFVLNSERNHPFRQKVGSSLRIERLAERMIQRARALNPQADESWINPTPPPAPTAAYQPPTQEQIAAAQARVVRLAPKDFPELPSAIAETLTQRECRISQASSGGPLGNVVRGEFFEAGREAWAVICSRNGQSQILVFRSDDPSEPHLLDEFEDPVCLSEESNCGMLYGTNITRVDRDYIVTHYRAYGGPEPPPIDHHGLDVGIWEKGSFVRYFHNGAWLKLTGAD